MKVAQISGAYVGAQEIIEHAIHRECISRGYESCIFYAVGSSDEENIVCYENRASSFCRRALRKFIGKNPRFSGWSTKRLIRRLQAYQPDLVHLHVLHQGHLDYEKLFEYLIKKKIPVVYTIHDMWTFTGGCYYYTKENCTGYQTGCLNCPADSKRLDNPSDKTAYYFSLKKRLISELSRVQFVAVSPWVASEMSKGFLAEYPITVIENGIEPPVLTTTSFDVDDNSDREQVNLIGVATFWDERKGIDRIFQMARILGDKYHFHLVGSASDDVLKNAPQNVHFLGYVYDKAELLRLYAQSDLHVSASFEETFGMTFIEAAFVGTRSIGYSSTAVKSTLEGVRGIAVEELTAEAMTSEIQRAMLQGDIKLTSDEIQCVTNRYSSNTMAKKYCDIYQTVLKKDANS